jgi:O-antigen ligase
MSENQEEKKVIIKKRRERRLMRISELEKQSSREKASWPGRAIFVLLAVMMIVSVLAFGGVDVWMVGLNSIFAGLIVVFWLFEAWKSRRLVFETSPLQIPIIGLIVIGLIQLLPLGGSAEAAETLALPPASTLSQNPFLTRLFVIQLIIALVFFAAALTFIDNRRRFQTMAVVVIIFGSAAAFFGVLQHFGNPEAVYGIRPARQSNPFGTFFNQHHFAAFMEMTLGLTLGLLFSNATKVNKKIFLAAAAVIMGMALLLTGSRGGLLGFLAVLGFVMTANFLANRENIPEDVEEDLKRYVRRRNLFLFGGGLALLFGLFIAVLFVGGDQSLLSSLSLSRVEGDITTGRLHFWSVALQIFFDHPIIGTGFDSFGTVFSRYDTWSGAYRVEQAHNDYLQILADGGILSFVMVAAFIYLLYRQGFRSIRKNADKFAVNGAVGALAGCTGILIHSFVDFPLRTPSNALFFLMLAAFASVPVNFRRVYRKRIKMLE